MSTTKRLSKNRGQSYKDECIPGVLYTQLREDGCRVWTQSNTNKSIVYRVVYNPAKLAVSYFVGTLTTRVGRRVLPTPVRKWEYRCLIQLSSGRVYNRTRGFREVTFQPSQVRDMCFTYSCPGITHILHQFIFGPLNKEVPYGMFLYKYTYEVLGRNYFETDMGKHYRPATSLVRPIAEESSIKVAAKRIFGVSSSQAVNILMNKPYQYVAFVAAFSKYIPWDTLMKASLDVSGGIQYSTFKRFISLLPMKLRLKFLQTQHDYTYSYMDTYRMLVAIQFDKQYIRGYENYCDNITQLHDFVVRANEAYQKNKNSKQFSKKLSSRHADYINKMTSKAVDGWYLRVPKTYGELYQWGVDMQHCIYNYASAHANGSCVLFGLYNNENVLMYNIMMSYRDDTKDFDEVQFYGKYNSTPISVHRQIFYTIVDQSLVS
jgi:hypothetical protein